jgi:hypothetical protein
MSSRRTRESVSEEELEPLEPTAGGYQGRHCASLESIQPLESSSHPSLLSVGRLASLVV